MNRSRNLQVLRGVAALLVFVLHSMFIEQKYGRGVQVIGAVGWLGSIAVDLFFALSGFIMISITAGRFQNRAYAVRFGLERIFRVYPTYWVISLPVLVLYLLRPDMVNSAQGGKVNLLESFLLLPQSILPLLAVGWTLVHEMYFYLVFALAVGLLPERWRLHLLIFWGGAILVSGLFRNPDEGSVWLQLIADPLTLDFIAGGLVALWSPSFVKNRVEWGWGLIFFGLALFVLLLWLVPIDLSAVFFDRWWRVGVCAVPCALIILGSVLIEQWRSQVSWLKGVFERLGDLSYSFYLLHLLVLSAAGKVWLIFIPSAPWSAFLVYVVTFVFCVVFANLSYRYIEMPTLSMGRKIAAAVERRLSGGYFAASRA